MRFLCPAALCQAAKKQNLPGLQQSSSADCQSCVQKELWGPVEPELLLKVLCAGTEIPDVLCFLVFQTLVCNQNNCNKPYFFLSNRMLLPCLDQTLYFIVIFSSLLSLMLFKCIQVIICERKQAQGARGEQSLSQCSALTFWQCEPPWALNLIFSGHVP